MKEFISIDPNKIDDLPLLEIEDKFLDITKIHSTAYENIKRFLEIALTKDHDSYIKFNYNDRNLCLLVINKKNDEHYQNFYYVDYKILLFDTDGYEKIGLFKVSKLFFEKNELLKGVEILIGDIIKYLNAESDPNTSIPKDILTTENIVEIEWEEFKHV